MANPISYRELFDFDGLEDSLKSLEQSEGQFAASVSSDLTRLSKNADKLKKSLQGIRDQLAGTNITTDSGQSQLRNLVTESDRVKKSFQEQKQAIDATKSVIQANREEVARLRAEQARLKNEYEQSRISQQKYREETARLTLESKKLDLANKQARDAVRNVSGAYKELSQTLNKARAEAKNIGVQYGVNSKQFKDAAKNVQVLDNRIKEIDTRLGQHQRNVGNYSSVLGGVRNQLGQLAAGYLSIYTAIQAVQYTFNTAMKTDAISASLTFTYKSADIASERLNNLKKIAEDLGLEFIGLSDSYRSFAGAAVAANFPLKEMEHIFLAVSNAGAKMKLSNEQINGALTAIQQMISKGNVQAEELRGQLGERLPGAFSIAARAMGVTEQELNKMLKAGEVLASDLLPKLANELDKTFGYDKTEKINSLQASWNRLKNTFSIGIAEQNNIVKFFQVIIDSVTNASSAIIKTVNSSSWKEFFFRMSAMTGNPAQAAVSGAMADAVKMGNEYNKKSDISKLLERFSKKNKEEQEAIIKAQEQLFETAKNTANKTRLKSDADFFYKQQEALVALRKAYNDLYQTKKKVDDIKITPDNELTSIKEIRDRITELSKMPGSAESGSEVAGRIAALKARLKELTPSAKEAKQGLAMLEDQLKSLKTQLEIGLLDGTIDKSDKKIAESINQLEARINQLKKMRDGLLKPMPTIGKIQGSPDEVQSVTIDSSEYDRKQALQNLSDNQIEIEKRYAEHHARLLEDLRKKNITQLEYDAKVNELEKTKLYENYFVEKSILQKRLEGAKVGSREYLSIKRQQARLEESFQKDLNDNFFKTEDLKRQVFHQTMDMVRDGIRSFSDIMGSEWAGLFEQLTYDFESFINDGKSSWQDWAATAAAAAGAITSTISENAQMRIEKLQEERDHEIKGAGDNAAAKEKIEIEYNKRIAKEKQKKARAEKAAAMFSVAINTASAILAALAPPPLGLGPIFGIPVSIAAGVMGAAQLAIIAARPIPQYYKGTKNSPEGVAEVAERGPELIEDPDGNTRLAKKRQFTYLKKGSKVYTAEETKLRLSKLIDRPSISSQDRDLDRNMDKAINYTILQNQSNTPPVDYNRLINGIGAEIKSIPVQENHWDERGHTRYRREKNARIKELNERNSRTGNG